MKVKHIVTFCIVALGVSNSMQAMNADNQRGARYDEIFPLHAAASQKDCNLANQLITGGADVNLPDRQGRTPLNLALNNAIRDIFNPETTQIVQILVNNNADVNWPNPNDGNGTPLHRAATHGCVAIVRILLGNGADVTRRDNNGATPLHHAAGGLDVLEDGRCAVGDRTDTASLLLAHRAHVDARNNDLSTPLHRAAFSGNVPMALLLLKHGASVDAQSNMLRIMKTPLDIACLKVDEAPVGPWQGMYEGRRNIAQLLRDWQPYLHFRERQLAENLEAYLRGEVGQGLTREQYIAQLQAEWLNHRIEQIHTMADQERERERNHQPGIINRFFSLFW